MRILLLEDEESIRGFVRINLKRGGMDVTEAADGETALALAGEASPPFDIALLDVMLPTMSGFEVCSRLREQFPRMGIIMLTAKSQEEDKIFGLELGADDYVQKPFSPGELVARVSALYRRMMPGGLSWPEGRPAGEAPADGPAGAAAGQAAGREPAVSEAASPQAPGAAASPAEPGMPGAAGQAAGLEPSASGSAGPQAPVPAVGAVPARAKPGMPGAAGQAAGLEPSASGAASPQAPGAAAGAAPASAEPGIPGAAAEPAASGEAGAAPSQAAGRGTELRSGPFRLSEAQRRLWKDGAEIVLTPTEWTLVRLLMERAGEGLSRDEILNAVWGRHFVGDLKIVDVNIRRIRQKLEDEPSEPKYIETLWGYGYRWERSE